jgi:hypothetical protein
MDYKSDTVKENEIAKKAKVKEKTENKEDKIIVTTNYW